MRISCLAVVLLFVGTLVAKAEFATVSLAPVTNKVLGFIQNPPQGHPILGGVPFDIPVSGNNSWDASVGTKIGVRSTTAMVLPVNVYGATAVDSLITLGWGVLGSHDVTATFIGSNGANYSLDLIAGTDLRNWLDSPACCNTINGTTTTQVFQGVPTDPGAGQIARLDKQRISLPPSFATQTLTKFILIDDGVSGDVTNTIYNNAESQRSFLYGLTVETVPIGDYTGDGIVDARDYVLWRSNVGNTVPACSGGDANCNGFVERSEYDPWRANFGRGAVGSGLSQAGSNVPESSTAILAILSCASVLLDRLRRKATL